MTSHAGWELTETMRILSNKPGTLYQESDEFERAEFRRWLKGMLQQCQIEVQFVKSDGTLRNMHCTLQSEELPNTPASTSALTEDSKPRAKNDDAIKVWDLESKAWRSFRYDRIKKIIFNLG